jgi:hypothetical protein
VPGGTVGIAHFAGETERTQAEMDAFWTAIGRVIRAAIDTQRVGHLGANRSLAVLHQPVPATGDHVHRMDSTRTMHEAVGRCTVDLRHDLRQSRLDIVEVVMRIGKQNHPRLITKVILFDGLMCTQARVNSLFR